MKIGILTLPFNNNYGGYLQAYALMTVLKDMGHEVELINRRRNYPTIKYRIKYFLLGVRGLLMPSKKHSFFIDGEGIFRRRGQRMLQFARKYISPVSSPLFSAEELKGEYGNRYDVYIVGSDQVWRPIYVPDIQDFFFRFVTNDRAKKIVYAASFGNETPEFDQETINVCGKLIRKIDAIGLREQDGIEIIRRFGWKPTCQPQVVLDPTMLLEKGHYMELIRNWTSGQAPRRCLFDYVLDYSEGMEQILQKAVLKLKTSRFDMIDLKNWKRKSYVMPYIEDWLCGIANAAFVVTDSFHGMVFSIIFNTPFAVCVNKQRGASRFKNLLDYFGLSDRIVRNVAELENVIDGQIDWVHVNEKLHGLRDFSLNFLKTNIDN